MLSRVSTCGELPDSYQLNRPELATRGLVFGRNTDSDIVLNTEALPLLISRKHAEVSVAGQTLCIIDAGSTNGTYVNEQRLRSAESRHLTNGDAISFGGPKLILRDGQQHSNPFVYVVSAVESLTGQAQQRLPGNRDSAEPAAGPASAANYPQPSSAPEQVVDLTRTSSDEAGPSHVVDLTSSPDAHADSSKRLTAAYKPASRPVQRQESYPGTQHQLSKRQHRANTSSALAGHKRTKSVDESAAPAEKVAAPTADSGAKQALENEFECTICRDFMVATHSVVPCGHMFCGGCLSEWLQKNPTCPKCRAAATAPPVRTMAVDNVLESLVEKGMSAEELQERKQRKQHWDQNAAVVNAKLKSLFRQGAPHAMAHHGRHAAQHVAGMLPWEEFAAAAGVQLHMAIRAGAMRPHAPPAVTYTVKTHTSSSRVLCKGCRNPIAMHSMQIGYSNRNDMRWYHLGCLGADKWQEASMPGRLNGLPSLHPSQQDNVQRHYLRRGPR
ncbi:TPA: hypothetical protein ACH3X3_013276 [Trebouxia sp. C0006]